MLEDVFQMGISFLLQMTWLRPRELEVLGTTVLLGLLELATDSSIHVGVSYWTRAVGSLVQIHVGLPLLENPLSFLPSSK